MNKCPGQDPRRAEAVEITCLNCGYIAEIFSDEIRIRCPGCKGLIYKERLPSCIDWCKAAKDCVGMEKWNIIKGGA